MKDKFVRAKTTTSDEPYFVSITLLDGAQFGAIPASLKCKYSGAGLQPALTDSPPATINGSVATYRLAAGATAGEATDRLISDTCTLTFGANALNLTSGMKDYGIRVTAVHYDAYDKVSATVVGKLITFTQGAVASVQQGGVTVDVRSPSLSKEFLSAGTVGLVGTTKVAKLGSLSYVAVTGVLGWDGNLVTIANILDTFTLTVSGSPLAAAQETAATGVAKTAGVYLSLDNCANDWAPGGTATRKYSSGSLVSFDAVTDTAMIDVCMIANNVNTIDRGQVGFTISSVVGVLGNYTPNMSILDTTLVKVVKNGTSLKVLNIPPPDYTTDQAAIRFYNMGTTPGRVTGTLYSQGTTDGNNTGGGLPLGTANTTLIEALAPNAVKVLSGPDIGKLFGQTTWPGRAWLQIESEIKGLRVQALVRTIGVNGQVLTNMSDRIMLDGETLQRTE